MKEIRWHARAGQGAITVAELLAATAVRRGGFALAFPEFGPERRGAPLRAYNRLDDEPIRLRHEIDRPDVVVVLDPTLLETEGVTQGLKPEGLLLINASAPAREIGQRVGFREAHGRKGQGRIIALDAAPLAEQAGLSRRFVNVPLLGVLLRLLGYLLEDGLAELRQAFAGQPQGHREANAEALTLGYQAQPDVCTGTHVPPPAPQTLRAWQELEAGALVAATEPDHRSDQIQTGSWRTEVKPVVDARQCVHCLLCWAHCPEPAILVQEADRARVPGGLQMWGYDYAHCKGCGICAAVCPTGAITMVPNGTPVPARGWKDKDPEEVR